MRYALSALFFLGLWLLMSGVYKPLVIGFGVASSLLVVFIIHRMDETDGDRPDFRISVWRYVRYFFWLLTEIARANWAVTKLILAPRVKLRQHMFFVPMSQKTELMEVTFANSITLTPGTITIETEPGRFLVHALNYSDSDDEALADMDRRVSAVEVRRDDA